jgi:hypothetical protein
LNNLEFVLDRVLDLKEWDSSKKIEQIKKFIVETGAKPEPKLTYYRMEKGCSTVLKSI